MSEPVSVEQLAAWNRKFFQVVRLNEAMGIFHMGQRNSCWVRISKDARKKGFKIRHFGVIIHARLHESFGKIIDKAQIRIYTNQEDVDRLMPEAEASYDARDARMAGMTDESVDTFYSCTLCQSFAPNHVCVVKPERLGLCGAYSWLDAKACYELNPAGPNQPITKGAPVDDRISGEEICSPRTVVSVLTLETSTNILLLSEYCEKASRLFLSVTSSSAPPSR